ncbi:hypothetical protein [Nocardia cyriacigeorgica]|jgi:hypothetical protein|uniref:hypothetical protein n=1 Tax=Nocardia cyriacigeorgica TaxID=135487 RepID=UPI0011B0B31E|nr:hypothetical protein [Nocardia cyriacigeorgica]MBF6100989.1 hypothetical protein [Nocardia cyriacigeorgica]MBF6162859.1 hypothetical protein [Nocardia cyriacigeorgica]MBF6201841.1 hypothetical protein [Nocardia cyriacigeorgica]MBF6315407.1 hypothetical protein [Nocardia cyriacigeorgica]MBF6324435.1 hypothetical protein [Nocardia cyriacigeorgica]
MRSAPLATLMAGAAIVFASACSPSNSEQDASQAPSSTAEFPYPEVRYYSEISIPMDESMRAAAEFALAMSADGMAIPYPETPEATRIRFLQQVSPESDSITTQVPHPPGFIGSTGGITQRVVGAREIGRETVEFAICAYNTPGTYSLYEDGNTVGPTPDDPHPYQLTHPRVQWTDRPAADGSKPGNSRWLLVDMGIDNSVTDEMRSQVCEPFKPEPFIQQMPDPINPSATPTR